MFTPKIFLIKSNKARPWDVTSDEQKSNYNYISFVEINSNFYEECEFQSGAMLFNLSEASRVCAYLNKINLKYFEIDIRKDFTPIQQSKLNG